jgi:Protein of unknown function (DUF2905)
LNGRPVLPSPVQHERCIATGTALIRHDVATMSGATRNTMDVSRFLIGLGLVIFAIGVLWPLASKLGLGRLPGDIAIERGNTSFYFPIVTCLLLSVLLSAVMWLFNR